MEALQLIRECDNDFWDLDEGLDKHIDQMNSSDSVRTMYSKRGESQFDIGLASYLTICYIKNVEELIHNNICDELTKKFAFRHLCKLEIEFKSPQIENDTSDTAAPYLKYISGGQYWNIYHVKFQLEGGSSADHNEFWSVLTESLSRL
jgi:hypothetical protein